MSEFEEVMENIGLLSSEDPAVRELAETKIRAMGEAAIPYLNRAKGQKERYSYHHVFQMLVQIGDDMFAVGGNTNINQSIIETMEYGAKRVLKSLPEEIQEFSIAALTRWGLDVPEPYVPKVLRCHICGRPSTEIMVKGCFLLSCEKAVCEEHTFIMETRFGKFTGTGGAWFCTKAHYEYANRNPAVMM